MLCKKNNGVCVCVCVCVERQRDRYAYINNNNKKIMKSVTPMDRYSMEGTGQRGQGCKTSVPVPCQIILTLKPCTLL